MGVCSSIAFSYFGSYKLMTKFFSEEIPLTFQTELEHDLNSSLEIENI
jgi:hypothetical protein